MDTYGYVKYHIIVELNFYQEPVEFEDIFWEVILIHGRTFVQKTTNTHRVAPCLTYMFDRYVGTT